MVATVSSMLHHRMGYLVLVGITLGAYLDFTHTHGSEITYPPGTNHWRGILTFAFVYSVPSWLYACWCVASGCPTEPVSYRLSVPFTFVFALCYLHTSYGDEVYGMTADDKTMLLGAASAFFWLFFDRSWQGFVGAAVTAAAGCYAEHSLCESALMNYTSPQLGRVPYWLFALYFLGTVTWGHCARRILTDPDPVLRIGRM